MAIRFAGLVDGHDVGMIQRRGGERLPFEAMARHRVGELTREDLDGDRALQARVPRPEHPPHAADAKLGFDDVPPEPFAWCEAH